MKNKAILVVMFLLAIPFISSSCDANVSVTPTEIYLNISDIYVWGNTSRKITVINDNSYNISVKSWMNHPDIIEWMRPNRTLIENISWITIEPSQAIIPANSSRDFYIYFDIPNETKNQTYDKHWEIWAAVKAEGTGNFSSSFNKGYLVRVYVDIPPLPEEPSSSLDQIFYDTLFAIGVAVILTIAFFFFRERKKRKKE